MGIDMKTSKIEARIEDWKNRLVDLSRRNRSIYFRPSKSSSLEVEEPSMVEVFKRLVVSQKPWIIYYPEEAPEEEEEQKQEQEEDAERVEVLLEGDNEELDKEQKLKPRERRNDEIKFDTDNKKTLEKVLTNLYRKSNTDYTERGIRTLHLVFGLLCWKEKDGEEEIRSPLVLLPVVLSRKSSLDPFCIETTEDEDEPILNPTIAAKLQNDFKIKLPQMPEDITEVGIEGYFKELQAELKGNMRIIPEIWLSMHTFHKYVMYNDLVTNKESYIKHPIIQALCGEKTLDVPDLVEPNDVDKKVDLQKTFLVIDADSSQLACIENIQRGTSLVIHGPPGTGKSQTITNIIANCISNGKSVLFVSEKMAALEVVFKRIQECGLGRYCLELHSHKANKKEVVEELYSCTKEELRSRGAFDSNDFRMLEKARSKVNDYVVSLHAVRDPLKRSIFQIFCELIELPEDTRSVPLGFIEINSLTQEKLDEALEIAKRIKDVWYIAIEKDSFCWYGLTKSIDSDRMPEEFLGKVEECISNLENLIRIIDGLCQELGLLEIDNLASADWLVDVIKHLNAREQVVPREWITDYALDALLDRAKEQEELTSSYKKAKNELVGEHGQKFLELNDDLLQTIQVAARNLDGFLGIDLIEDKRFINTLKYLINWVGATMEFVDNCQEYYRIANGVYAINGESTFAAVKKLTTLVESNTFEHRPLADWFSFQARNFLDNHLDEIEKYYQFIIQLRKYVFENYDKAILELDLIKLKESINVGLQSKTRAFKPDYHSSLKTIKKLSKLKKKPIEIASDLEKAVLLKQNLAKLAEISTNHKALFGNYYNGIATDFSAIRKAYAKVKLIAGILETWDIPEGVIKQFCLGESPDETAFLETEKIKKRINEWRETTKPFEELYDFSKLGPPFKNDKLLSQSFDDIEEGLSATFEALKEVKPIKFCKYPTTKVRVHA